MAAKREKETTQAASNPKNTKSTKPFTLKKDIKIGVLLFGEGAEFFDDMKRGFLDRLEELQHSLDIAIIPKQTKHRQIAS